MYEDLVDVGPDYYELLDYEPDDCEVEIVEVKENAQRLKTTKTPERKKSTSMSACLLNDMLNKMGSTSVNNAKANVTSNSNANFSSNKYSSLKTCPEIICLEVPENIEVIEGRTSPISECSIVKSAVKKVHGSIPPSDIVSTAIGNLVFSKDNIENVNPPLPTFRTRSYGQQLQNFLKSSKFSSAVTKGKLTQTARKTSHFKDSIFDLVLKSARKGVFDVAFENLLLVIDTIQEKNLKQIVNELLEAGLKYNRMSVLTKLYDLLKTRKLSNSYYCSLFIIACKAKPRETHHLIMKIFNVCEVNSISISLTAIICLYDFWLNKSNSLYPIRLINFTLKICKIQEINKNLFEKMMSTAIKLGQSCFDATVLPSLSSALVVVDTNLFCNIPRSDLQNFVDLLNNSPYCRTLNTDKLNEKLEKHFSPGNDVLLALDHCKMFHLVGEACQGRWRNAVRRFKYCILDENQEELQAFYKYMCLIPQRTYAIFRSFVHTISGNQYSLLQLPSLEYLFIAALGVTLALECYQKKETQTACKVLELLHKYEVDYIALRMLLFRRGIYKEYAKRSCLSFLSTSHMALILAELYLQTENTLYAYQLFKDHSWIPIETQPHESYSKMYLWKVKLLLRMCKELQSRKLVSEGVEVLNLLLRMLEYETDAKLREMFVNLYKDINFLLNTYLAELLNNRKSFDAAEKLYKLYKIHSQCLKVKAAVLRAFIIRSSDLGFKDKLDDYLEDCILQNVYRMTLPDVTALPHTLKLKNCYTAPEIRLVLNYFMTRLFERSPLNMGKRDSEKWYSVKIVLKKEQIIDKEPFLVVLNGIITSFSEVRRRVIYALHTMDYVEAKSEDRENTIVITPASVYKNFMKWTKVKKEIRPSSLQKLQLESKNMDSATRPFIPVTNSANLKRLYEPGCSSTVTKPLRTVLFDSHDDDETSVKKLRLENESIHSVFTWRKHSPVKQQPKTTTCVDENLSISVDSDGPRQIFVSNPLQEEKMQVDIVPSIPKTAKTIPTKSLLKNRFSFVRLPFSSGNATSSEEVLDPKTIDMEGSQKSHKTGQKIKDFLLRQVSCKYKTLASQKKQNFSAKLTEQFLKENNLMDSGCISKTTYLKLKAFAKKNM